MLANRVRKQKGGAHLAPKENKNGNADMLPVSDATQTKRSKQGKRRVMLFGSAAIVVLAGILLLSLCGFTYLYPSIFPGVTIGAIPVGGMRAEEAAQAVQEQSMPLYQDAGVSIRINEQEYTIPVIDVLEGIDTEQTVQAAMAIGRDGSLTERVQEIYSTYREGRDVPLAATVDEKGLSETLDGIAAQALTEPVEPSYEVTADSIIIHSGTPGVRFNTEGVRVALEDKIRLMDFTPFVVETGIEQPSDVDWDAISAEVSKEMINASVSREDGQTILPEQIGVSFDLEAARELVQNGTGETYTIPLIFTQPQTTVADLQALLFRDTLASATTELSESNEPRTNNVRLAAKAINGTILNPGDEFSYNQVVGERTEARGYQSAGAYSDGQVIEETGGGVCQPSSTLYMAVLRADLEVTQRQNHSFTVSYTPLGEDATVSWGGPDFCFRNNTEYPIKILAEQTNGQMIMTILGTKTNDKSVEMRTEVLETYSPQTIEREDSSMPEGETRVEQTGITGYSTRTYKQVTVNGETTETLANTSNYSKRDRIVYVGTGTAYSEEKSEQESGPTED